MVKINEKAFNEIVEKYHLNIKNNEYFIEALTHSSYANEHSLKSNERIEFLGDAVLGLLVAEYLYESFPNIHEGKMTKIRASYVCEDANAGYCRKMGIDKLILLGHGEELSGGRSRPAVLNDAFEAFLGAVYLSGGLIEVKKILAKVVFPEISENDAKPFVDYKSQLQEYIQAESRVSLKYRLDDVQGPPHKRIFTISAVHDGISLGTGVGSSKKDAEQMAAKEALEKMVKK
ncbi:MAG: ribonuclease III [Bacilli bacterium]|nr:ribonuclease III [Bacilli bacterium]